MNFSLNITPKTLSGIKVKMPEANFTIRKSTEILSVQDYKYRKSGSSLAFDVYKLPAFLSKTIYKLSKAMIYDDNQRRIYANGFKETLRFLKSAAKTIK